MKTKLSLLATGIILAALGTSWGQPVITNQPGAQATAPGATVTFQVGASSSEPLAYQWQKNPGNVFPISRTAPMPPWSWPTCSRGTHLTIAWWVPTSLARGPVQAAKY